MQSKKDNTPFRARLGWLCCAIRSVSASNAVNTMNFQQSYRDLFSEEISVEMLCSIIHKTKDR